MLSALEVNGEGFEVVFEILRKLFKHIFVHIIKASMNIKDSRKVSTIAV